VTVGTALYSVSLLLRNLCSLGGRLLGTKVTGPEVLWLTPGMQTKRSQMGADDRDAKTDDPEESIHASTRSHSWHRR
jgi:hypothetical protein